MRHLVHAAALALAALAFAGCREDGTSPRDVTAPAAPRGVYSVTGDHSVTLHWLANTEGDVAGYRIYEAPCATGDNCPYDRVGTTTAVDFTLTGLSNGVTKYFAVAAVDHAGNESALSYETVFDTPRPAGTGATISNFVNGVTGAGWDFSAALARASNDVETDVYYGYNGSVYEMFTRDLNTDIQDMGFTNTLDAIDFAPPQGWSPSGTVELIPGHSYVVWTRDNHYAKFRVTSLTATVVTFDWAYQTDPGNGELRAHRAVGDEGPLPRPVVWLKS